MPKVAAAQASALTEAMFLLRDGIFASSCKPPAAVPVTSPGAVLDPVHAAVLAGAPAAAPLFCLLLCLLLRLQLLFAALAAVQVAIPAAVPAST